MSRRRRRARQGPQEWAINEGFVNMSTAGWRGRWGESFFDFGVSAERHSALFSPSKCLASAAISLIYYVFPWIGGGIFCFHPQHVAIINSSLIPLCWLHVRPYLPLNTLSPINIFQISDTICGIQMKLSLSASLPPVFPPTFLLPASGRRHCVRLVSRQIALS